MKTPLHNCDIKMFAIEEGMPVNESNHLSKLQSIVSHCKFFKWFVTINILILLTFCGYALCSLYQLEEAMQSKDTAIQLNRYMARYNLNLTNRNITRQNNDTIESDIYEWRNAILGNNNNLEQNQNDRVNTSYNLKFLLHSITSIVQNFVNDDKINAQQSSILEKIGNSSTGKLVISNLTDFEIHILQEFTKLKMNQKKTRFPRTANVKDVSKCDLNFSVTVDNKNAPMRVKVQPVKKGEGMIEISNIINKNGEKNVRECTFNLIYEPIRKLEMLP